jgi:hypothetical protein
LLKKNKNGFYNVKLLSINQIFQKKTVNSKIWSFHPMDRWWKSSWSQYLCEHRS